MNKTIIKLQCNVRLLSNSTSIKDWLLNDFFSINRTNNTDTGAIKDLYAPIIGGKYMSPEEINMKCLNNYTSDLISSKDIEKYNSSKNAIKPSSIFELYKCAKSQDTEYMEKLLQINDKIEHDLSSCIINNDFELYSTVHSEL